MSAIKSKVSTLSFLGYVVTEEANKSSWSKYHFTGTKTLRKGSQWLNRRVEILDSSTAFELTFERMWPLVIVVTLLILTEDCYSFR